MGEIQVPGIGRVRIAGDEPSQVEERRIQSELARRSLSENSPEAIKELERRTGQQFNVSPAPTDIPPETVPAEGQAPETPSPGMAPARPSPGDSGAAPTPQPESDAAAWQGPELERRAREITQRPGTISGDINLKAAEGNSGYAKLASPRAEFLTQQILKGRASRQERDEYEAMWKEAKDAPLQNVMEKTLGLGADSVGALYGAKLGADIGAVAGAPGRAVGAALGGVLGFATASTTRKAAEDFLASGRLPTAGTTLNRYVQAIKDDMIGQSVVHGSFSLVRSMGNAMLKTMGAALGVASPEVQQLIKAAASRGIDIGVTETSGRGIATIARMLSSVPILSGPLKREMQVKQAQVGLAAQRMFEDISPGINITALSNRIEKDAGDLWLARRNVYDGMKDSLFKIDEALGSPQFVRGDVIRDKMLAALNNLRAHSADLPAFVKTDATTNLTGNKSLDEFIVALFPPEGQRMTLREANAVIREIRVMFEKHAGQNGVMSPFNKHLAGELDAAWKEGLHESVTRYAAGMKAIMASPQPGAVPQGMSGADYSTYLDIMRSTGKPLFPQQTIPLVEDLVKSSTALRQEWANISALERSVAAGLFNRVDKNFWKAGFEKPGSIEGDTIATTILNSKQFQQSPAFVADLEKLVGRDNVLALTRQYLEKSMVAGTLETRNVVGAAGTEGILARRRMLAPASENLIQVPLLDGAAAKKALGLDGKETSAALAYMLRDTGTNPKALKELLDIAEKIHAAPINDASSFLARRLVLSGPQMLTGGIAAGGAAVGIAAGAAPGKVTMGGIVLTSRTLSNLISTPRGLRLLTHGMRDFEKGMAKADFADRLVDGRASVDFLKIIWPALGPEERNVSVQDKQTGRFIPVQPGTLEKLLRQADREAERIIQQIERDQ